MLWNRLYPCSAALSKEITISPRGIVPACTISLKLSYWGKERTSVTESLFLYSLLSSLILSFVTKVNETSTLWSKPS